MASSQAGSQVVLSTGAAEVVQQFSRMLTLVPEADDSEAAIMIAGQVLGATSLNDIDKPWAETEEAKMTGKQIVIHGATRRESDFQDGLGWYFRIDYTDIRTGERSSFSTGSVSILAQVAKAYTLDALPFAALVVEAEKATKRGFHPQHLEILDDQSAAQGA